MKEKQCKRHNCPNTVEAEITLENGAGQPSRTHYFCLDHYQEALTIAEMMRRLTGIPEIRREAKEMDTGGER